MFWDILSDREREGGRGRADSPDSEMCTALRYAEKVVHTSVSVYPKGSRPEQAKLLNTELQL